MRTSRILVLVSTTAAASGSKKPRPTAIRCKLPAALVEMLRAEKSLDAPDEQRRAWLREVHRKCGPFPGYVQKCPQRPAAGNLPRGLSRSCRPVSVITSP